MTADPRDPRYVRYPPRVTRRYADSPRSASDVRAGQRARYGRGPLQSTKTLTMKLLVLSIVGTLLISGLIAAQMASGNDPALGPKAVAQAKRSNKTSKSSSTQSSNGAGSDPYSQGYGGDYYYYGGSSGYSGGSSGSSGYSGSSGSSSNYSYSPPPVTSSTS